MLFYSITLFRPRGQNSPQKCRDVKTGASKLLPDNNHCTFTLKSCCCCFSSTLSLSLSPPFCPQVEGVVWYEGAQEEPWAGGGQQQDLRRWRTGTFGYKKMKFLKLE